MSCSIASMSAVPPQYSIEPRHTAVPCYSLEPLLGERRLEHNPRVAPRRIPTGTFQKCNSRVAILLTEQEDGASFPTYGRNAKIRGEVFMKDCDDIFAVTVKVDGYMNLGISEGGTMRPTLLSREIVVWQSTSPSQTCPEIIPFECTMPPTYQGADRTARPLPPSFSYSSPGIPGLFAQCEYTLTVEVTKNRNLVFWKRRKNLVVPINYCPHTRPHRPILGGDVSLFSTLKPSPEEWHQVTATMETRPSSVFQPIQCHVFIPSAQIYAITDTIPFHVQLRGTAESMNELTTPPPTRSKIDYRYHLPHTQPADQDASFIRVFLMRQIIVTVRGQRAWRDSVIGEGTLRQLPPYPSQSKSPKNRTIDWEGEVRCNDDVKAGGFNVGNLLLKDFLVLALIPSRPTISPLLELQHAHPIRLVTDPYLELPGALEAMS